MKGILVGSHERIGGGWPTGTTVVLAAAADTFAHAVSDALLAAESVSGFPSYREIFPSLFA